ncbi:MAG TPA: CDGSH iron-sulfur domain-containing protein [Conexibacter sp.]|nr:CDGSH iron-sulfur domain-containing protein [Conexibacter sp.]
MSTDAMSDTPPLSVRLPIGVEQPVAPEVVQVLVLAGCAARQAGRREADTGDLIEALEELLSAAPTSPPAPSVDAPDGGGPVARVVPYRDGPYILRGAFELTDQDGRQIETRRSTIALCRCGRSQIRPFCDGTHKLTGFHADSGAERPAPTGGA